jgi:ankyrin repeat protein
MIKQSDKIKLLSFDFNRDILLGEYDVIKKTLESLNSEEKHQLINGRTKYGSLPLVSAVGIGIPVLREKMVKLLIENGADVNGTDNYLDTGLMIASYWGYLDTVKILLEHNANKDLIDDEGQTALFKAQKEKRQLVVDYLNSCL